MEDVPPAYRHWQIEQGSDRLLWLRLDCADKEVNTLSREVLEELDRILAEIPARHPMGVVIGSGKRSGFIAGADIAEFSTVVNFSEALKFVERVHAIFDRLENLPVPTVCLIHGFCLGGGLELALACRYRIAAEDPGTTFGMPEVKLGIHPGFGGTVRLPRLIGPPSALNLMLSGRNIDAGRAHKIGLVDALVPERQLAQAARKAILHNPFRRKRSLLDFLFQKRGLRRLLIRTARRTVAKRAVEEHYPAPYALMDLWERYGDNPAAMFREEARSVANLVTGATCQNLVRVFTLRERIKALGKNGSFSHRSVHVVGGGTMGGDIAAWCALQGLRVTIQDVDRQRLSVAVRRASDFFRNKIKNQQLLEDSLRRLVPDYPGEGIARADIVIEAIFENIDAKRKLYQKIEPRMRKDALLATNTSSIPLEELSGALRMPERFLGLHFFNPVAKMQLVEVVKGKGSEDDNFRRAMSFVSAIGRLPLPVISSPGFLVNRILTPYLLEAVIMEQEGIPAAEIDRAARKFGMPMGPLLLADSVGLDICLSVSRFLARHFKMEVPKRLEALVEKGQLGKKSGRGFYVYKKQKPVFPKTKTASPPGDEVSDRLMLRLLNEAVACWREEITADGDLLDAGMIFGIGFAPFRGGPLHYVRSQGVDLLHSRLKALEERYGDRFAADAGWKQLTIDE